MRFLLALSFLILTQPLFGAINFESWELNQVLKRAKLENKLIFVELIDSESPNINQIMKDSDLLESYHKGNYINIQIDKSHPDFRTIIKDYDIKSYPSYIYLNPNGKLILPVQTEMNKNTFLVNARIGIERKNEEYPLAQMDLDYAKNRMSKSQLYEYINKRTLLGYDNSLLIDDYTRLVSFDALQVSALKLFLLSNSININGLFFNLVEKNKKKIMENLHLNELSYSDIVNKCIHFTFEDICKKKDETALNNLLKRKEFVSEDAEILRSEYFTKFYYETHQPLKLAKVAPIYADRLIEYNKQGNSKSECGEKLCQAAQYIVETLSNKGLLNNALYWVNMANKMDDNFKIYETKAYLLYKLGKRQDAIACMEKASSMLPENSDLQGSITHGLIKMKRGERIF